LIEITRLYPDRTILLFQPAITRHNLPAKAINPQAIAFNQHDAIFYIHILIIYCYSGISNGLLLIFVPRYSSSKA